jgi:adenine-specific DNA-methyltransferase
MVQLPEATDEKSEAFKAGYKNICEIGKERIRRAGKKILEDNENSKEPKDLSSLDIGFRVLKVDSSNMKDVYFTPNETTQNGLFDTVENIKDDRKPLDLLFGVLIDWGLELSDNIEKRSINGKDVYFVDDNELVACFDDNLNEEFIKELANISKDEDILKVVFKDSGFDSDDTKDNVEQIFKQISPNTDIRAI